MKTLSILGSTGSIGTQVLDIVSRLPERLRVVGLAAHRNVELLAEQVRRYQPSLVSIGTEEDAGRLREKLTQTPSPSGPLSPEKKGSLPEIAWGREGLMRVATMDEAQTALRLRAIRDFSEDKVARKAGDEWLFQGPGTYIPRVEVQVVEVAKAIVLRPNQALRLPRSGQWRVPASTHS